MAQGKQRRGEQDDGYFGAGPSAKKLAEAFEQIPSEDCLFPEARADNHHEHHSRECSPVSCEVMVGGIDCRRAEEWHHDRLHQEFKRAAENDAGGQTAKPALRSHVADLTPWRM